MVDELSEELKKTKLNAGKFFNSFDDFLEWIKSIDGTMRDKTMWQFLYGAFDNGEITKGFQMNRRKCG